MRLRPAMSLFCDASFCHATKAAGWGAWVKTDGMDKGLMYGGVFRKSMNNPGEAEICAIVNAIHAARTNVDYSEINCIYLQSDSLRALGIIAHHVQAALVTQREFVIDVEPMTSIVSHVEKEAVEWINKFVSAAQIVLMLSHVKGHSNHKGGRFWVNSQCDAIAKEHMEAERERRSPSGGVKKKARKSKPRRQSGDRADTQASE